MKRAVRFGCVLCFGMVLGALGHYALTCIGVNLRLLPYSLNGHTIVAPDRGVHDNRVDRIFAQFAHKVPLPATSSEVHAVLQATWLKPAMISQILVLGGWIPVSGDGEAFLINLASETDELTGTIWICISGPKSESEALDFLTGKGKDSWRLKEFALCFPARQGEMMGRIEMFSWWGIQVRQWG